MANQIRPIPGDLQRQALVKMLLHGRLTRLQLGEAFGVSQPAVTRHARWLVGQKFVSSSLIRLPNVKRPVEVFAINERRATCLALSVYPDRLVSELTAANAATLVTSEYPVEKPTQYAVLAAMRWAVQEAGRWAKKDGRGLDLVGLSVSGYIEPMSGMVFGVSGIEDWQPCLPGLVLEELHGVAFRAWTQVASKLEGMAVRFRRDDRIGYIEKTEHGLAVASMQHGLLVHGRFGTAGSIMHQRVSDDPQICYCGRKGCLEMHLHRGDASAAMILSALPAVIEEMSVEWLGVEWRDDQGDLKRRCEKTGVRHLEVIGDAGELARSGARHRCARLLLDHLVVELRPMVPRRLVKPAVLRRTLPVMSHE